MNLWASFDLPRSLSAGVGGGDGFDSGAAGDGGRDSDSDSEGFLGTRAGALRGLPGPAPRRAAGAGSGDWADVSGGPCAPTDCGQREPDGSKPAGALEILDVFDIFSKPGVAAGIHDLSLVCRGVAAGGAAQG